MFSSFCGFSRVSGAHMSGSRSHSNLYNSDSQNDSSASSNVSSPDNSPSESPLRHSLISNNDTSVTLCRRSPEPVSFENMCRDNDIDQSVWNENDLYEPGCDIDDLNECELKKLQPLLWLEMASIFDRHNVAFDKRKPYKRKRKEEGNVFGVSLNALVRRDQQVTGEDSSLVPLLLQGILGKFLKINFFIERLNQ